MLLSPHLIGKTKLWAASNKRVVLDEAQNIKKSQRPKPAPSLNYQLTTPTGFLTGTPVENRLLDSVVYFNPSTYYLGAELSSASSLKIQKIMTERYTTTLKTHVYLRRVVRYRSINHQWSAGQSWTKTVLQLIWSEQAQSTKPWLRWCDQRKLDLTEGIQTGKSWRYPPLFSWNKFQSSWQFLTRW